ncbi:translation initiation factor IF-3 [Patescibacteria group bacterium]|nr:translation initiation factor IF-3 [Patescibacteria group bacterium]
MRRIKQRRVKKKFYQLNQYIRSDKLRVIGFKGEQLGVLSKDEALFKANQLKIDLVVVAEKADPPVAKLIYFKKFRYQQSKKQQTSKKKKTQEQKEVRFSPFMAQNDFNIRIKKAEKFLKEGHRVKLAVKFKGIQLARKEFGYNLLKQAIEKLSNIAKQDSSPKMLGRLLITNLIPIKKHVEKQTKNSQLSPKKV